MTRPATRTAPAEGTREIRHWQAVAVLAALALFFFKDILLGNAYLWEDFLYYSFPARNFAAASLARGEFPLWNPYTLNGMPFFADIQTTVLYLPSLLLTLFVRDGALSHVWLQLVIILHYVLAGAGMYFLAMSFRLRRLPALFAGVAYMLSSFTILHAIHQQIITMVAWFPLILLLFRNVLAGRSWLRVALAALVLGHSILAGFPQLTLYLYFFLFVYFLFEMGARYRGGALLSRDALHTMLRAAAVVGLSLGLTAVQLLPTMELGDLSQRAAITYEKATEGQMSWGHLLTLVFPKFFGVADAASYNYWGPGTYWYYWETCIYRGAVPLLLTLLSLFLWKKNRIVPFLWAFSGFALLFALGDNFFLHRLFYAWVPGFSTFRSPARMLAFFGLAVALLSAFSLQHLLYGERTGVWSGRWRRAVIVAGGVAAALWLLLVSGLLDGVFPFMTAPAVAATARKELLLSLVVFLVSAAMVSVLLLRRSPMRWSVAVLVGGTMLDLLLFGGSQNNARLSPADYFRRPQAIVRYMKENAGGEIFRVNARNRDGMIMDRNQGMIDRLFMMEGYTPLALQRVYPPVTSSDLMYDLLNVKFQTVTNAERRTLSLEPRTGYLPRAFLVYAYTVASDEAAVTTAMNDARFDPRITAVLETDPGRVLLPPAGTTPWKAKIQEYRNNAIGIDVTTEVDGLLVLSEIHYPGWKAYVDGVETPVYRTNYNLRGMFVPAGTHRVEVRFQPESVTRGMWISLASLLLCGTGAAASRLRKRHAAIPEA